MRKSTGQRGFTLIETLVVLGLLTGFCLFLAQILRTGVTLFDEGESGQDLADRAQAGASAVEDAVLSVLGPTRDLDEGQVPEARLFVTRVPGPAIAAPGAKPTELPRPYPFLVSSVRLDADQETALLAQRVREEIRETVRGKSEVELARKIAEVLSDAPRSGRGVMWLFAHPQGDPENAYVELRRRLFLAGQRVPSGPASNVDPLFCEGDGSFAPVAKYWEGAEVVASGVLWFDVAFWSQYTRSWDATADGGPERNWDSARAGHLSGSKNPRENFTLDLTPSSLTTPSDDVWPHYAQITVVVDRGGSDRPDALLARDIGPGDTEVPLMSVEHLPPVADADCVKIGSEWVQYRTQGTSSLQGVLRGKRGTPAVSHPAGTRVRVGKTVVLTLKLSCGRDCWNG